MSQRLETGIAAAAVGLTLLLVIGCSDPQPSVDPTDPSGTGTGQVETPVREDSPEDELARAILTRLERADSELTYTGVKVAVHGRRGESRATRMRVHRLGDGTTILEWGGSGEPARWRYMERFAWLRDFDLLLRNYRLVPHSETGEPIAGRATEQLDIVPRRAGRPSLTLDLDVETGLVLGEQHHRPDGTVRLGNRFEEIEYGEPDVDIPDDASECLDVTAGRHANQSSDEQAAVRPEGWTALAVSRAPEGFQRIGRELLPCGTLREYWSDGLAAFSLLQRPAEEDEDPDLQDRTEGELTCDTSSGMPCLAGVFDGVRVVITGSLSREALEDVVRGLASSPRE